MTKFRVPLRMAVGLPVRLTAEHSYWPDFSCRQPWGPLSE